MPHRLPPFSMPITKRTATFALTCTLLCSVTPADSQPTSLPTAVPTSQPTGEPTSEPTGRPTNAPTAHPTSLPTSPQTRQITRQPTVEPTAPSTQRCAAVTELQPRGCCGGIASQGGQLVQLNPAEITQFACHDVCRNSSTCVAFDANVEVSHQAPPVCDLFAVTSLVWMFFFCGDPVGLITTRSCSLDFVSSTLARRHLLWSEASVSPQAASIASLKPPSHRPRLRPHLEQSHHKHPPPRFQSLRMPVRAAATTRQPLPSLLPLCWP